MQRVSQAKPHFIKTMKILSWQFVLCKLIYFLILFFMIFYCDFYGNKVRFLVFIQKRLLAIIFHFIVLHPDILQTYSFLKVSQQHTVPSHIYIILNMSKLYNIRCLWGSICGFLETVWAATFIFYIKTPFKQYQNIALLCLQLKLSHCFKMEVSGMFQ